VPRRRVDGRLLGPPRLTFLPELLVNQVTVILPPSRCIIRGIPNDRRMVDGSYPSFLWEMRYSAHYHLRTFGRKYHRPYVLSLPLLLLSFLILPAQDGDIRDPPYSADLQRLETLTISPRSPSARKGMGRTNGLGSGSSLRKSSLLLQTALEPLPCGQSASQSVCMQYYLPHSRPH
jgi:hypothetical protein